MGNLIGNAKVIGASTDDVVRTIQALISAGYKGEALLDKIDEIYGVGARNNLLKVIDYELPQEGRTVVIEYPQISPNEKTKIGDILIGSNGYIGRITALETDSDDFVSSVTILGLDYNIIENILPTISTDDNYKVLTVGDGIWLKDYINRTNNNLEIYGKNNGINFESGRLKFIDRYVDGAITQDRTNRGISIEPIFVPYTEEDNALSLYFSDDNDRPIKLYGIREPDGPNAAANKKYVDEQSKKYVPITYSQLVILRDNDSLIPGHQYRIIDYVATVDSPDVIVEEHPFDIIVIADSENALNENARACLRDNDNYYSINNADLSAWELKYCLDNDTEKFNWAKSDGKGVIYYLKDDYGNECPYDFKQIKFETHKILTCSVQSLIGKYCPNLYINNDSKITYDENDVKYLFTFSRLVKDEYADGSVVNDSVTNLDGAIVRCQNNVIKECYRRTLANVQYLNSIVLVYDNYPVYSNYFDFDCADMMLCDSSYGNTFGKFSFGNAFGENYSCNTCDSYFCYNLFGEDCRSNVFLANSYLNVFENNFSNNKLGCNCSNNTFGMKSIGNIIENSCSYLLFGNYCANNTFKSGCNNIELRTAESEGNVADRFSNNIIENGNSYMILWSAQTSSPIKNYIFLPGIVGTSENKEVIELTRNLNYCTFVGQYS